MDDTGEHPAAAPTPAPQPSTMRRDLLSAYAASGAKVLSWVIVSAIVFRTDHVFAYGMLALARGVLSLLNYTTLGLSPVLVRLLAEAKARPRTPLPLSADDSRVLSYASTDSHSPFDPAARSIYVNGVAVALLAAVIGVALTWLYSSHFEVFHSLPMQASHVQSPVWWLGIGVVLRLMSEPMSAILQTAGRIARDNQLVIFSEAVWALLVFIFAGHSYLQSALWNAAAAYSVSGAILLGTRTFEAYRHIGFRLQDFRLVKFVTARGLVKMGMVIAVAQLADFLYAPTDYILINRLISPGTVAYYAPAVQINAGLLLLVGGLAAVLLPKAATAYAAGDHHVLRRYYIRGTIASAGMLLAASGVVYFLSPVIFRLWLGDPLPQTQAILPLVLLHTVLGGSGGVGRSILLGMGKAKPFAIGVLVAGVTNVIISYCCVKYFNLGLPGIIWGTVAAAFGLCVVWQPWYVLRTLKREQARSLDTTLAVAAAHETPL